MAGLGAVLACVSLVRLRHKPGPLCPGPRTWKDIALPWNWLLVYGCWYDLTGLADTGQGVRCPECGTLHKAPLKRRREQRLRSAPLSVVLLLAASGCWSASWVLHGGWA